MNDIIVEGHGFNENTEDGLRREATKALDTYLSSPIPKDPNDPTKTLDTYLFWRSYERTSDRAKKCLCMIAKRYLTPPPTRVCVERSNSTGSDILKQERNRLNPECAEKLLFMRENLPRLNFKY